MARLLMYRVLQMKCSTTAARPASRIVARRYGMRSNASMCAWGAASAWRGISGTGQADSASRSVHVSFHVLCFWALFASAKCGLNEDYLTCGTCDQLCMDPAVRMCPQGCKEGCFCLKGYSRNSQGVCVTEAQCGRESGFEI